VVYDGQDFSTFTIDADGNVIGDMDLSWQPIVGTQVVAERVLRRLTCPPGSFDDQTYGIDLRGYLNASLTSADLSNLQAKIRAELLKEEALDDVGATCILTSDNQLYVELRLTLADEESYNFAFVLSSTGIEKIMGVNQNG
jgi:hypothetical protein